MTWLHQQTDRCSDFDVRLGDQTVPAFRVLLPEWIHGEGVHDVGLLHIIPGNWQARPDGVHGRFAAGNQFRIDVEIETLETRIRVRLTVENTGAAGVSDVWANVCASLTHLPGEPGWSNRAFLPAAPLERFAQGRYWYEVLAPARLFALGANGWRPMHPCPDQPVAGAVPLYDFTPSQSADTCACAVETLDGGLWFFQSWDAPCRWCAPSPGNACMHLEPRLADHLPPRGRASIQGQIGLHAGDRASLEKLLLAAV